MSTPRDPARPPAGVGGPARAGRCLGPGEEEERQGAGTRRGGPAGRFGGAGPPARAHEGGEGPRLLARRRTLASGGDDATVRLWDVATGIQRRLLDGFDEPSLWPRLFPRRGDPGDHGSPDAPALGHRQRPRVEGDPGGELERAVRVHPRRQGARHRRRPRPPPDRRGDGGDAQEVGPAPQTPLLPGAGEAGGDGRPGGDRVADGPERPGFALPLGLHHREGGPGAARGRLPPLGRRLLARRPAPRRRGDPRLALRDRRHPRRRGGAEALGRPDRPAPRGVRTIRRT